MTLRLNVPSYHVNLLSVLLISCILTEVDLFDEEGQFIGKLVVVRGHDEVCVKNGS